jgi:hypothetical protein
MEARRLKRVKGCGARSRSASAVGRKRETRAATGKLGAAEARTLPWRTPLANRRVRPSVLRLSRLLFPVQCRLLAQARDAFWQTGFSGTSLDDLSTVTAMNRPSLYGAFGDKRALYLTTIERYIVGGRQAMEKALDPDLPLKVGLKRVYEGSLALYFPEEGARARLLLDRHCRDRGGARSGHSSKARRRVA